MTNSWIKRAEAKRWNAEHAEIVIRTDIDRTKIAEHFREEAAGMDPEIERLTWNFGHDCQCVKDQVERKTFLENVAKALTA